jgi:glucose-6-phosphate dehydrogenase assembly protein OpcA
MADEFAATWDHPLTSTVGVEQALAALTRRATEALGACPAARARMHNLVALSTDPASAAAIDRALAAMGHRHPSRLVRVRLEPTAADGVRALAAVRCHVEGDLRCPIVFEIVEIAAGGGAARHLAETVAPALEADLPVILWWAGSPPFGDPSFAKLLRLADRLLLDSAAIGIAGLRSLVEALASSPPVVDLAWERLRPSREVIASAFDEPALDAGLDHVQVVEIGGAGSPVEPRLLAGWLASRLGWHVVRPPLGSTGRATLARSGEEITLWLATEGGQPGLHSLTIRAGGYHLTIAPVGGQVEVRLARDDVLLVERRERLAIPDEGKSVLWALTRGGRDERWEAALRVAADLVRP